jgi:hypothetical protein
VIVALRSGVPHDVWLDDTRALMTALDVLAEADRQAARRR